MSTVEVVTRICGYEVHEAASAFPMLGDTEAQALAESVKANGQIHPIVLLGEKILDGRNRAKACEFLGIAPKTEQAIESVNPWDYVVAANAERRELDPSRKTAIRIRCLEKSADWNAQIEAKRAEANAARSRSMKAKHEEGKISTSSPNPVGLAPTPTKTTNAQLAEQFGVGKGTVQRMIELKKKDPVAFEKVCAGEIQGRAALEAVKAKEKPKEKPKKIEPESKPQPPPSLATYAPVNTDTPETIWGFVEECVTEAWNRSEPSVRWRLASKIENLLSDLKERTE